MRRLAILLLSLALAACKVGPDYRRPQLELPAGWRISEPQAREVADTLWWEQFQDPVLAELILAALKENKDLKLAAARVEEFQGRLGLARGALYPSAGAGVSAGGQRTTQRGQTQLPASAPNPTMLYQANLFASWELDLWGRLRRATGGIFPRSAAAP